MFEKAEEDTKVKSQILNYVNRLRGSFDIYKAINSNAMESDDLNKLIMIGRINPFYPLMMIVYKEQRDQFEEFISDLIKFTFRSALISLRSNGESDFYRYIREKNNLIEAVKWPVEGNWWNINN